MKSAIYTGTIVHHRLSPKVHRFCYKIQMLYIDLDELGSLFQKIPLWRDNGKKSLAYFKRTDYHAPHSQDLKSVIQDKIYNHTKTRHSGPIRMLANINMFGYCFNPVVFYYCFNEQDTALEYVVAEVNNTPWGEKYSYIIDFSDKENFSQTKKFHVSPFLDMNLDYDFKFNAPNDKLNVHMLVSGSKEMLKAYLSMQKKPINKRNMIYFLLTHGLMNYKFIVGIYWQAFKLLIKGIRYYPHP